MSEYKWACIGCGHIANEMAQAFEEKGRHFYGVYSRTRNKADDFAKHYGINKVYNTANELFADDEIDIVYIATPHNRHIEYILKSAQSKKHILCEKAITLNSEELSLAKAACDNNAVILAEAMTVYHMPVYKKAKEYIENGRLGKLKLIEVNLGSNKEYDMTSRFFSKDLAGGAMLDIGVYALSFVRNFFTKTADDVKSSVKLAPTGVDEQAVMLLSNSFGEMAGVTLSLTAKLPRTAVVSFENGYIEFENYNRSRCARITFLDSGEVLTFESEDVSPLVYEIEDMEKAVDGDETIMHFDFTADVMDIMTNERRKWKVIYPEEINN